jgi:hypothetical protein
VADPPLPYDQLTLSFKVIELGGWDNVIFKFPAGTKLDVDWPRFGDVEPRSFWLCTEHVNVLDKERARHFGRLGVLKICAQDVAPSNVAQIVDVRVKPKDTTSGQACRKCVRKKTSGDDGSWPVGPGGII